MNHTLSDVEIRVLGSLVEKEITTPDYYPLSLNALVAACNQSSNRNPVTHFDEETVARAADTLRERKLVHLVDRFESRVSKYRHVLYETMNLGRPAIAVMCVLMLRGPQTIGEIRTRSARLYDFGSLESLHSSSGCPGRSARKKSATPTCFQVKSNSPNPNLSWIGSGNSKKKSKISDSNLNNSGNNSNKTRDH